MTSNRDMYGTPDPPYRAPTSKMNKKNNKKAQSNNNRKALGNSTNSTKAAQTSSKTTRPPTTLAKATAPQKPTPTTDNLGRNTKIQYGDQPIDIRFLHEGPSERSYCIQLKYPLAQVMNALNEVGNLKSIPLFMKNKWLSNPIRYEILQHHITTLPRDKYTWSDCLLRDTFTSVLGDLMTTHLFVPDEQKDSVQIALRGFGNTRSIDYIHHLDGPQQMWILPYLLLTMPDVEHTKFLAVVKRDYDQLDEKMLDQFQNNNYSKCQCSNCKGYCMDL